MGELVGYPAAGMLREGSEVLLAKGEEFPAEFRVTESSPIEDFTPEEGVAGAVNDRTNGSLSDSDIEIGQSFATGSIEQVL